MKLHLLTGIAITVFSSAALAQVAAGVPQGSGLDAWTDKNGDKLIQRDEVKPGTSLETVFARRDKDKSGFLDGNEYFMPGM